MGHGSVLFAYLLSINSTSNFRANQDKLTYICFFEAFYIYTYSWKVSLTLELWKVDSKSKQKKFIQKNTQKSRNFIIL